MESLISDESAMDPEFLPSVGPAESEVLAPLPAIRRGIWLGLSRSWAIAVFIVTATAAHHWGMSACIVSVTLACIVMCIKECCVGIQTTGAGTWLIVLHHTSALSVVAKTMCSTLIYLSRSKLHAWISEHFYSFSVLFTTLILLFVSFLFVLGLGPSRLFRKIVYTIMPMSFLLMAIGMFTIRHSRESLKYLFDTEITVDQVLHGVALFISVFSGAVVDKMAVGQRRSLFSLICVLVLWISCLITMFFLFYTVDSKTLHSKDLMTIDALTNGPLPAMDLTPLFTLCRGGLALACMVCLSLTLVEVLAACQRSVVALAGHLLPAWVARDSRWTGTQLCAISFAGLLACLLATIFSPLELVRLSSVCYLLSHACDVFSALHRQSQPSFVPKHTAEDVEGGGSYQLLSGPVRVDEESEDSDSDSLSDDSGHSTDTDIDAIVHEYKESVKVVSSLAQQPPAPTVRSGRLYTAVLLFLVAKSLAEGYLWTSHPIAASLMAAEIALTIGALCRLPKQCETSAGRTAHLCVSLCLDLSLTVTLLRPALQANAFLALSLWMVLGLLFWTFSVPVRRWCHLFDSKSGHGKGKLQMPTRLGQPMTFRATFHKLSPSDMVPIIR